MHLLLLLLLLLFIFPAQSNEQKSLPLVKNNLLFSFDRISVVEHEKMGLLGGSYLYPLGYGFQTGLGIFGAVEGDRGGFFTGGLNVLWDRKIYRNVFFAAQLFAGGGGGGAAPQGGGLMHRVSGEFGFSFSKQRFAAGVSYINFPNGKIESEQFTLSYSTYIENLHLSGFHPDKSTLASWSDELNRYFSSSVQNFSLHYLSYHPHQTHKGRSGKLLNERMDVVGIGWSRALQNHFWFEFETAGALEGGIDGFAQVLMGFSYRLLVRDWLTLNSGGLLGAAGGGDVDTGGGTIFRAYTGFGIKFSKHWLINNQIGMNWSVDGQFTLPYTSLSLVYVFSGFNPVQFGESPNFAAQPMKWRQLRIRSGVQTYFDMPQESRKNPNTEPVNVDLASLKLDAFVNSWLFVTGHALGAATGGAGGYAVGLVGPGVQFSRFVSAELLFGAAGGGGLAVGSGKIFQPMLNFEIPINQALGIEASLGYIDSVEGDMSGPVSNLSLSYYFMQPYY